MKKNIITEQDINNISRDAVQIIKEGEGTDWLKRGWGWAKDGMRLALGIPKYGQKSNVIAQDYSAEEISDFQKAHGNVNIDHLKKYITVLFNQKKFRKQEYYQLMSLLDSAKLFNLWAQTYYDLPRQRRKK